MERPQSASDEHIIEFFEEALEDFVLEIGEPEESASHRRRTRARQKLKDAMCEILKAARRNSYCTGCLREHAPGRCLPADV